MTGEVGAEIRKPGIGVVWIEKYAIFRQNADGVTTSLDHMMLAEVLPSFPDDQYHVEGFRGDETQPFVVFRSGGRLSYVNEWLIDRKVCSHASAAELDARWRGAPRDSACASSTTARRVPLRKLKRN